MTKYHLAAVGVGVLIGLVLGPKLRTLPLLSKVPTA